VSNEKEPDMTETPAKPAQPDTSANAIADFGIDTTSMSTGEAIKDYFARMKDGQLGSIPAVLGVIVLAILFSALSGDFFTLRNIANLLAQGAGQTIIAMGIVFVLLLGEIDLSAGTASGLCASVMALHYVKTGNLLGSMGTGVFISFLVVLGIAVVLALLQRIWAGAVIAAIGIVVIAVGVPVNAWLEMLIAICVGTAIGCITGFLVSKIGMPSFVVTLALFIVWQGVILQFIGEGGTLPISTSDTLNAVANGNLSVAGSWILFIIAAGGYALVALGQHFSRRKRGLVVQPTPIVLFKVGVVAVLAAVSTALLSVNRSSSNLVVIEGIPFVVPIVLVLLVAGTYVLNRTRYGRHIYAVGGNKEAARRAGINVAKLRTSVFVISSTFAAIGAIVYSSKIGAVNPQSGGLNTLLFAVGAAVIGGTSLFGGKGRMIDAVIGGTVLAIVTNGLGLLQQSSAVVNIVTGLVLMLAASVDALSRRRAAASAR
jgi:D-xylose transport system permease protein